MKVVCLTLETLGPHVEGSKDVPTGDWPVVGSTYTVDDTMRHEGILFYSLVELPLDWHDARNFAPISSIDETELIAQREGVEV